MDVLCSFLNFTIRTSPLPISGPESLSSNFRSCLSFSEAFCALLLLLEAVFFFFDPSPPGLFRPASQHYGSVSFNDFFFLIRSLQVA